MKRLITFGVTLIITFSLMSIIYANEQVSIFFNGKQINFETKEPIILNENLLVPAELFEKMGFTVTSNSNGVTFKNYVDRVTVEADSNLFMVNGIQLTLTNQAKLIENTLMLPLREICNSINADVDWDNNTVNISYNPNISKRAALFPIKDLDDNNKQVDSKDMIEIDGKKYYVGQSVSELEEPDRIDISHEGYIWYIYNNDLSNYHQIGIQNNKVIYIYAMNFRFDDKSSSKNYTVKYYKDNLNKGRTYAISLHSNDIKVSYITDNDMLSKYELQIFDITNAFRIKNNLPPFEWSDKSKISARYHSQDMADNNYYDHKSLDGTTLIKRMVNAGVDTATGFAENIGKEEIYPFEIVDKLINSKSDRENILDRYMQYMGVGMAYNEKSKYKWYTTQNFYK